MQKTSAKSGPPDETSDDAGSRLDQYAQQQVDDRLRKVRKNARAAAACPCDPDSIHDLRVAIRRLFQAREVFDHTLAPRKKLKFKGLRKIMKLCGHVRNYDIAAELLDQAHVSLPDASHDFLAKKKLRAEEKLGDALEEYKITKGIKRWRRRVHFSTEPNTAALAQEYIETMIGQFFDAGVDVFGHESRLEDLHQFRLLSKRLRYTYELFEDIADGACRQNIDQLRKLQDALGAVNDCVTTRDLLLGLEKPVSPQIITVLARLQHRRFQEFQNIWRSDFENRDALQPISF